METQETEQAGEAAMKDGFVKVTAIVLKHAKTKDDLVTHQVGEPAMRDIFVDPMVVALKDVELTEMILVMEQAKEIVRMIIYVSLVDFVNIRRYL